MSDIDPKAKARLERDMAKLRKQMKDLGKQLEREHGMKDFDPLKNMNPKYPFNILPDKKKATKNNDNGNNENTAETPFGPGFPFTNDFTDDTNNHPFGKGFPFNQQQNPFGYNNPFFDNLFRNSNAYYFTPPPHYHPHSHYQTPPYPPHYSHHPRFNNNYEYDYEDFYPQFSGQNSHHFNEDPGYSGPIIEEVESDEE